MQTSYPSRITEANIALQVLSRVLLELRVLTRATYKLPFLPRSLIIDQTLIARPAYGQNLFPIRDPSRQEARRTFRQRLRAR